MIQMSDITICLRNFRNMKMYLNEVSYDFNLVASYYSLAPLHCGGHQIAHFDISNNTMRIACKPVDHALLHRLA